jgi:hypothetical protein
MCRRAYQRLRCRGVRWKRCVARTICCRSGEGDQDGAKKKKKCELLETLGPTLHADIHFILG